MARIHRVLDGQPAPSPTKPRIQRLDAIIGKAERFIESAEAQNDPKKANALRKRARATARLAARLIGIMVIEFNQDVPKQIDRTRNVFLRSREKQEQLNAQRSNNDNS